MYKVRKGMVVFMNTQPQIANKMNPVVTTSYNGKTKSHLLCGDRPHIVVSNDEINKNGQICWVVPVHSNHCHLDRIYNSPEVQIYNNDKSYVSCHNILTVNQMEIDCKRFVGFVSDEEMVAIDKAIMNHLLGTMTEDVITDDTNDDSIDDNDEGRVIGFVVNSEKPEPVETEPNVAATKKPRKSLNSKIDFTGYTYDELLKLKDDVATLHTSDVCSKYKFNQSSFSYIVFKLMTELNDRKETKRAFVVSNRVVIPKPSNTDAIALMVDSDTMSIEEIADKYRLTRKEVIAYKKYINQNM